MQLKSRRIRFAPLPDPRRAVLIGDDGKEFPILTELPDSSASSEIDLNVASPLTPPSAIPASLSLAAIGIIQKPSPLEPGYTSSSSSNSHSESQTSLGFLTPTQTRTSTHEPQPTPTQPSSKLSTQILTLGTINLFRATSRPRDDDTASLHSTRSGWSGVKLQRWTSTGSTNSENSSSTGVPLSRSQSLQSMTKHRKKHSFSLFGSNSKDKSSRSRTSSGTGNGQLATLAPSSPSVSKKGTRMLNGRVYGARRSGNQPNANANPFANVRDEEPEFVEWGYGGMGSVKNGAGVGGNVWGKLMSDNSAVGGQASTTSAAAGDDDDDGGGMAWVRKRREQREREKREKEEQEAKEKADAEANAAGDDDKPAAEANEAASTPDATPAAAAVDDTEPSAPTHSRKQSSQTLRDPVIAQSPPSMHTRKSSLRSNVPTPILSPSSTLNTPDAFPSASGMLSPPLMTSPTPSTPGEEEHVLTIKKIPTAPAGGRHHKHQSRDNEENKVLTGVVSSESAEQPTSVSSSSSSSSSSVDSDSDRDDDDEDEDSDSDLEDDEGMTDAQRKTCLGAGVEKMSRHNREPLGALSPTSPNANGHATAPLAAAS